jgi:hypothetical protein
MAVALLTACSSSTPVALPTPPNLVSHASWVPTALEGTWEANSAAGQYMALYQDQFAFFNDPGDAAVGSIFFKGDQMTFEPRQSGCEGTGTYRWALLSNGTELQMTALNDDPCPRSAYMAAGWKLHSSSVVPLS